MKPHQTKKTPSTAGRGYWDEQGKYNFVPDKPKTAAEIIENMKLRFGVNLQPASPKLRAGARKILDGIAKDAAEYGLNIYQDT